MIETERLILRPPIAADRAALHAMWADPLVMADMGPVKSAAQSDAAIARHDGYRDRRLGFLVAVGKADGEVAGFCGLKPGAPDTPIADEVEAGWMLTRAHWGQGLAIEAVLAILAWGWANLAAERIVAITSARNVKSQGLMLRLGMRHLLDFDHHDYAPGNPLRASVAYAIERPR